MEFMKSILLNIICLGFPFCAYLVYLGYAKNVKQQEKRIFLDVAIYSSTYLSLRFGGLLGEEYRVLLFNIPLLIGYLKDRKTTVCFLSLFLAFYQMNIFEVPFWLSFCEYFLYLVSCQFLKRSNRVELTLLNLFVLVKAIFLTVQCCILSPSLSALTQIMHSFISIFAFYLIALSLFYLLKKGEEMMDLSSTVKQLEKEKTLRASLFKITHEIKNPIAVCKGYLDMLDVKDQDKVRRYIPIVQKEIERTLTLMDDYLDYTKIKIEKEEVDLYLLLEDTLFSLETIFRKNGIQTDFEIPDEELYMMLDYNRMKQVLYNLLKNAIEAKAEERDMLLSLRVEKDSEEVNIIITDNGKGMDEETKEHISEMFYTTKQKGSGLGVAMSKEIVELHGGSICYDSILGKGTEAIVTLPLLPLEGV